MDSIFHHRHTHTMLDYYSAMKKKENSVSDNMVDPEGIILNKINQTEKDKYYVTSQMEPK